MTNNLNPQISVVMTVYNGARFLKETVESLLNQSFQDFELIIVDNCSQDDSVAIIRSYRDPRIKLIVNEKNLGQTKALNVGLNICRGRFIARMDADDMAVPKRLELQVKFLEEHTEIAAVGGWCQDINAEGKSLRMYRTATDHRVIKYYLMGCGDLTEWTITHPTVMIRSEVLGKIGFYKEEAGGEYNYPQDYEYWRRMIAHGYAIANMPEILLKYRILEGSESRSGYDQLLNHRMNITREHILKYCPDFKKNELDVLVKMLEYLPQINAEDGEKVFGYFDHFFKAYSLNDDQRLNKKYNRRIKNYYLPVLSQTNRALAWKWFFSSLLMDPSSLFDIKFLKKVMKGFLTGTIGSKSTNAFKKKVLLHR